MRERERGWRGRSEKGRVSEREGEREMEEVIKERKR